MQHQLIAISQECLCEPHHTDISPAPKTKQGTESETCRKQWADSLLLLTTYSLGGLLGTSRRLMARMSKVPSGDSFPAMTMTSATPNAVMASASHSCHENGSRKAHVSAHVTFAKGMISGDNRSVRLRLRQACAERVCP